MAFVSLKGVTLQKYRNGRMIRLRSGVSSRSHHQPSSLYIRHTSAMEAEQRSRTCVIFTDVVKNSVKILPYKRHTQTRGPPSYIITQRFISSIHISISGWCCPPYKWTFTQAWPREGGWSRTYICWFGNPACERYKSGRRTSFTLSKDINAIALVATVSACGSMTVRTSGNRRLVAYRGTRNIHMVISRQFLTCNVVKLLWISHMHIFISHRASQ